MADLEQLARDLYGERDPAELFTRARPIRLRKHMGRPRLEIDLPGASKEELEVTARGPDLLVRVRDATRLVGLPGSVVGRTVQARAPRRRCAHRGFRVSDARPSREPRRSAAAASSRWCRA